MAGSHDDKRGLTWSLVSWGAAILGGLVVGWIVAKIFGEAAAGIIVGGVAFVVLLWFLSQRLGPPAEDEPHLPASAAAVDGHGGAASAAGAASVSAPVAAPLLHPVATPPAPAPAAPDAGAISERVREAARAAGEAARAAVGDVGPAGAGRPAAFAAPLEGAPDNLMRIKGIGPKIAESLHANGVRQFRQIAAWGPGEIDWVEANLAGFSGRVVRDDWVGQAKILASGGETEHSQRVDRGEAT
jgi:predicted flap endonuclease-1-like 5' DNA nuclease